MLFCAILVIELIESITAERTRGIAGKEINLIKLIPIVFSDSEAWGRKYPISRAEGIIINIKALTVRNLIEKSLIFE